MQKALIDFITGFEAASGFEAKWDCVTKTFSALGFDVVNYTVFPDTQTYSNPVFIENFRNNWVDHYAAQDYGPVDAMIPHVLETDVPALMFSIDERQALDWSPKGRQLISEAKEAGMERAVGFSHRNADGVVDGGVALGTDTMSASDFHKCLQDQVPLLYMIYSIAYQQLHPEQRQIASMKSLKISKRQYELLMALWDGLSNQQIADRLGVSEVTVSYHLKHLRRKLGCHLNREIVPRAYHCGLLGSLGR